MIVRVKPIRKNKAWNGFSGVIYKGCTNKLVASMNQYGDIVTGLTEEDAERLGAILNKDLSPTSSFWHDYTVILNDKELVLNTDHPQDELKYKLLMSHQLVAKSVNDTNAKAIYMIHDDNAEAVKINAKADVKIKASVLYSGLSLNQKKDILRLYPGFIKTDSVSEDIINARLYEQMDRDPAKFVALVEDKKRDMKLLIKDLVTAKILRKNKNAYYYGDDILGHDEESTITHLDDPLNQGLKVSLMKELKQKNK